jgi:hypothetical protein
LFIYINVIFSFVIYNIGTDEERGLIAWENTISSLSTQQQDEESARYKSFLNGFYRRFYYGTKAEG